MIPYKQVPKKNQPFEIGRTINLMKCCECQQRAGECDYMHCANYAKIMTPYKYSFEEFYNFTKTQKDRYFDDRGCLCSREAVEDFLDACIKFPNGQYWCFDADAFNTISMFNGRIKIGKVASKNYYRFTGEEFEWGVTVRNTGDISYCSPTFATATQKKLASRISKGILKLKELWLKDKK